MYPKALFTLAALPSAVANYDPDSPPTADEQIATKQIACPANWAPVCGSDGKVYSNACGAESAGLEALYEIDSPGDSLVAGVGCFTAVGPTWNAQKYLDSDGALVDVTDGSSVTLAFENDGTFGGSAGCNTYTGAYANATDMSFTVDGPLTSTFKMCDQELMTQEQAYLKIFNGTIAYSMSGDSIGLELTDDTGNVIAQYVAGAEVAKADAPEMIMCTMDWKPVCASDGKVHSNACEAEAAGLEVSYEIESPDANLAPNSACDKKPDIPVMCTMDWTPVCASNGKVYSNACGAKAAGLEVSYEIESPAEDLAPQSDCDIEKLDASVLISGTKPTTPNDAATTTLGTEPTTTNAATSTTSGTEPTTVNDAAITTPEASDAVTFGTSLAALGMMMLAAIA